MVQVLGVRWWLGWSLMLFAGFISGLLGIGSGAVILTPLLVLFTDIPIQYAEGISLVSALGTLITASSTFVRLRISNLKLCMALTTTSTAGAIIGSLMAYKIIRANYTWALYLLFSCVMYLAMYIALRPRHYHVVTLPEEIRDSYVLSGSYFDSSLKLYVEYGVSRQGLAEALSVMLFGGLISGLLGVGGGPINMIALGGVASDKGGIRHKHPAGGHNGNNQRLNILVFWARGADFGHAFGNWYNCRGQVFKPYSAKC